MIASFNTAARLSKHEIKPQATEVLRPEIRGVLRRSECSYMVRAEQQLCLNTAYISLS